jgi:hypothetical protein
MNTNYEYPKIVHATGAKYIDPVDSSSLVSYRIISASYFEASIELTDCSRKITWAFNAGAEGIEKVDSAISILSEFRKELLKASKKWKKTKEEADKFNEANKLGE